MGKTNRPDTFVSEFAALRRRVSQLETQQRLSSARISSGQLNVGAVGAGGQIEIDATDGAIRIFQGGVLIAALSTAEGLYISGYNADVDTVNGVFLQPKDVNGSTFDAAAMFVRTWNTGESDLIITSPMDTSRGGDTSTIIMRGSDAVNGGAGSMVFDSAATFITGDLDVTGMIAQVSEWISNPTFTGDGAFHNFTTGQWPQVDMRVPESGMIEVDIVARLYNSTSDASTAAVSCNVIDLDNASASVFTASLNQSAYEASYGAGPATGAAAPFITPHQDATHFYVAGLTPGHTVRASPAYRFSSLSGAPLRGGIAYGRMDVRPAIMST
jgi:hypothetical protein